MIGAVVLIGLLALQGADPAAGDEPIRTTIAEIHEDPWAWHGRTVRVVGDFSYCYGMACSVCDPGVIFPDYWAASREMIRRHCAGISFDWTADADALVRYNQVDFTAIYDATCSRVQQENDPDDPEDRIIFCSDRASQFYGKGIIRFLEVRPSTSLTLEPPVDHTDEVYGRISRLVPTESELTQELETAFRHATPYLEPWSGIEIFSFRSEDMTQEDAEFGVCVPKWLEDGSMEWPTELHQTHEAQGNPYTCYFAARDEDGEVFFPLQ